MRNLAAAMVALALVACGSQSEPGPAPSAADTRRTHAVAANAAPDLTACARPAALESSERLRTKPVAVPAALRPVMRSDMESFAFSPFAGGTVCVDASLIGRSTRRTSRPATLRTFDWCRLRGVRPRHRRPARARARARPGVKRALPVGQAAGGHRHYRKRIRPITHSPCGAPIPTHQPAVPAR